MTDFACHETSKKKFKDSEFASHPPIDIEPKNLHSNIHENQQINHLPTQNLKARSGIAPNTPISDNHLSTQNVSTSPSMKSLQLQDNSYNSKLKVTKINIDDVLIEVVEKENKTVYRLPGNMTVKDLAPEKRARVIEQIQKMHTENQKSKQNSLSNSHQNIETNLPNPNLEKKMKVTENYNTNKLSTNRAKSTSSLTTAENFEFLAQQFPTDLLNPSTPNNIGLGPTLGAFTNQSKYEITPIPRINSMASIKPRTILPSNIPNPQYSADHTNNTNGFLPHNQFSIIPLSSNSGSSTIGNPGGILNTQFIPHVPHPNSLADYQTPVYQNTHTSIVQALLSSFSNQLTGTPGGQIAGQPAPSFGFGTSNFNPQFSSGSNQKISNPSTPARVSISTNTPKRDKKNIITKKQSNFSLKSFNKTHNESKSIGIDQFYKKTNNLSNTKSNEYSGMSKKVALESISKTHKAGQYMPIHIKPNGLSSNSQNPYTKHFRGESSEPLATLKKQIISQYEQKSILLTPTKPSRYQKKYKITKKERKTLIANGLLVAEDSVDSNVSLWDFGIGVNPISFDTTKSTNFDEHLEKVNKNFSDALETDFKLVSKSQTKHPFTNFQDTFQKLFAYHVYQGCPITQQEVDQYNEMTDKAAKNISTRFMNVQKRVENLMEQTKDTHNVLNMQIESYRLEHAKSVINSQKDRTQSHYKK
ncbi:hypothetical protein BB559_001465 [Furculomyces boomerangus]|uniref:GLTSCR protein conserved domain-containing protein n=1 Tax=Furculomyces boomerangus TaxID=61424 RepID=A0A2T9Z1U8_9FUNG|nr:hypothetical protein BB559_001465 [Furculomyces boomerangus]